MDALADLLVKTETYQRELPPFHSPEEIPFGKAIAGWIDHTLLKPQATHEQIEQLCQEALECQFASVCVNSVFVPQIARLLAGSSVRVCATVGFPLGAALPALKVIETLTCLNEGATEIDMVIHVGALKERAHARLLNEIRSVVHAAHSQDAIVKVILETALLTQEEKILACLICQEAGADFVKTSTGFGPGGATVEDVELMHRLVGPQMGVKAAGGIRTYANAMAMIRAGATRLGSSSGVTIVREAIAEGSTAQ